jgi:hypothetical protein
MSATTTVWVCVAITLAAVLLDALSVRLVRRAARRDEDLES